MKAFRLIRSPAASAACNMALDRDIFNRYLEDNVPVLRVYRWNAPSFTYGISQKPGGELDLAACAAGKIGTARRMTGGGVLFHHDEITYSFACSKDDVGEPQGVFVSYRKICAFLIRFYRSLGLHAGFAVESDNFKARSSPHELCSAAYEKYDIVINGNKIGGNAQKRTRQAIFQHGSIPCSIDWDLVRRYAGSLPENITSTVTSLSKEMATVPDKDALEQKLIDAFGEEFNAYFIEESGSGYEACVAG